jgi:hypothetical protein
MSTGNDPQALAPSHGLTKLLEFRCTWRRQAGGMTIFTAIFVLVLMTLMLFYATRVGLFEQRISANEMRQKMAFHVAEAGMDYAAEYLSAHMSQLVSKSSQASPYIDGSGNTAFRAGWFSEGNRRWIACPVDPDEDHPCGGDIQAGGAGSLYYDDPATDTEGRFDGLPFSSEALGNLPDDIEVRVTALMCPRTLEDPTCLGAGAIPEAGAIITEPVRFSMWLMAYGYSDCNDDDASGAIDLPDECRGRAQITKPMGSAQNFDGVPGVPLVSKNSLPTSGTAEVVPNPNGGGVGVPLSIWANDQPNSLDGCPPLEPGGGDVGEALTVEGSFKTCEMHEWYGVDAQPADAKCNQPTCQCEYPGPEPISYRVSGTSVLGIDVMLDAQFPCDLFEYYFGYPSSEYQAVKANATVIDDCAALNETSEGFFWFSGDTCVLDDVGTINNPIILISAADEITRINGNTSFFGILYVANVEDPEGDAVFQPGGGATVYGAVIVDVPFNQSGYAGTFRVVYNDSALSNAGGEGGLGGLVGGWRDFGLPQISWEP